MAEGIRDYKLQLECLTLMAEWYDRHGFLSVGKTYHKRVEELSRALGMR